MAILTFGDVMQWRIAGCLLAGYRGMMNQQFYLDEFVDFIMRRERERMNDFLSRQRFV